MMEYKVQDDSFEKTYLAPWGQPKRSLNNSVEIIPSQIPVF